MIPCLVPALGLLLVPSGAAAQEPGVHLDPGSPAGKEYAIPVEQERRIGRSGASSSGDSSPGSTAGASTQLFGSGIRRGRPASATRRAPAARRQIAAHPAPAAATASAPTYLNTVRANGGPTVPLIVGGSAAAVLLLGAALLALMRRGARWRRT
jgi:hypothetical protein